jgi:hypothetical protein
VSVRERSSFRLARHSGIGVREPPETDLLIAALRTIAPPAGR